MAKRELHLVDYYLSDAWIEDWASEVIREVERYLAKHAAFDQFDRRESGAADAA